MVGKYQNQIMSELSKIWYKVMNSIDKQIGYLFSEIFSFKIKELWQNITKDNQC